MVYPLLLCAGEERKRTNMRLQALLSVMVGDKLARNSSQSDETELIFLPTGQENLKRAKCLCKRRPFYLFIVLPSSVSISRLILALKYVHP